MRYVLAPSLRRPGFTLVEVLIVAAILGIAAGSTLPLLRSAGHAEALGVLRVDILSTLRRAQHRALVSERGDGWGVFVTQGSFVLFRGASFMSRSPEDDEVHTIAGVYGFSGLTEVVFQRVSGTPLTEGTLTISHPSVGDRSIVVNRVGGMFLP